MNAEAITSAIRGVILGQIGEVRTVPAGAWIEGQPAQFGLHGGLDGDSARRLRAAKKRLFDVELAPAQRTGGLGSPAAAQAHIEVLPRVVLWLPITIVADTVSAKHRYAARADALAQARTIADALAWPGNLDRDADGTPTGLVSGLLSEAGPPRIVREDWSVGLYEVELRFRGLVKVTRAIIDPPAFVRTPTIYVAGAEDAAVGGTLIADPGEAVRASSLAGQWLRDGGTLPGETAVRYEIVTDDEGAAMSYRSTATGPGGVVSADSPAIVVVAGDFDPGDIPDRVFDYDAESYAGGTLLDLSGNGRDLSQSDPAKRPAQVSRNGQLALEYTGGQWLRGLFGAPLAQPLTVYVVAELSTQSGNDYVHDGDTNASFALQHLTASNTWRIGAGTFIGGGASSLSVFCSCGVFAGASSQHFLDDLRSGQEVASGNAGANGLSSLTLGARSDGAGGLRGFVWRVTGYLGAHDAPTRKLMGDYLAARYSIPIVT